MKLYINIIIGFVLFFGNLSAAEKRTLQLEEYAHYVNAMSRLTPYYNIYKINPGGFPKLSLTSIN